MDDSQWLVVDRMCLPYLLRSSEEVADGDSVSVAAIEGITAYCTILEDADEALFLLCAAIEKTVDVLKRQSNHPHKFIGANLNSPNLNLLVLAPLSSINKRHCVSRQFHLG